MADPYPVDAPSADEALPRCCQSHADWPTLTQHVIDTFPAIPIGDIVREVRRAKDAVDQVTLPDAEALEIGELIVRHQLMMRVGQAREAARLDPETHVRVPVDLA
jgi:hypothetical protein